MYDRNATKHDAKESNLSSVDATPVTPMTPVSPTTKKKVASGAPDDKSRTNGETISQLQAKSGAVTTLQVTEASKASATDLQLKPRESGLSKVGSKMSDAQQNFMKKVAMKASSRNAVHRALSTAHEEKTAAKKATLKMLEKTVLALKSSVGDTKVV